MTLDFQILNREDFEARFDRFVENASRNHPELRITPNEDVAWTPLGKPLDECTVALVTTAGVRHSDDTPFRNDLRWGDPSYRVIPSDVDTAALVSDEVHLDTDPAHQDINCLFPLTRLHELAGEGVIGSVASWHVSILGFLPDADRGLREAAKDVASKVKESGADIVVMTPG